MDKRIIIINGQGGAGKDNFVLALSPVYKITNISSVDLLYKFMDTIKWDGNKDDHWRKFMSDFKELLTKYDNIPNKYIIEKCGEFLNSDKDLLFLHVREPENINEIKAIVKKRFDFDIDTLLIRNTKITKLFNNKSDDDVERYEYDKIFYNDIEKTSKCDIIEYFNNNFK